MKSSFLKLALPLTLPLALTLTLSLLSCRPQAPVNGSTASFNPVDTAFSNKTLVIPGGNFKVAVLFSMGDPVRVDWLDTLAAAKGAHDFLAFLPINGAVDHGILWVNHEEKKPHDLLGDGGGASVLEVFRDSLGNWKLIGTPHGVDFGPVGGTLANCLGAPTPWGTILTSEEAEPGYNDLCPTPDDCDVRDSTSAGGWARWKNYGWMVEVDPYSRKAIGKRYAMGRMMHEGAHCMPDNRTVYLMDDAAPGPFYKFVADRPKDLSEGTLYAFKESPDGKTGSWLELPRGRDSLLYTRDLACKKGATLYIRMEDIEILPDGTFIISETGLDSTDMSRYISLGGVPSKHLEKYHVGNQVYDDKYGRLLRYDPKTNAITVMLEGGGGKEDGSIHLSNPDNLVIDNKRNQLVIHEDIVGKSGGRVPKGDQGQLINEIYFLDLNIKTPKLDDLQRFAVIPAGAESTGPIWNPDYTAFFFNIQHPSADNPAPYNKPCTVVVTGWK
jgi:uncharacterized protein